MIKRFSWCFLAGCLWAWGVTVAQGQSVSEEGAAVKLGTGATIKNTLIWGNKGKQLDYSGTSKFTNYIEGVNSDDPLFQDADNGDFRLKSASPCINAGSLDELLKNLFDLWGNPRLSGGTYDIGAYEYKTYKITFIKDPEITIDSIVNGVTYYASKVEPGGTYRFKVSSSDFTGIDKKSIIVKKVGGNEEIPLGADGAYSIGPVNSDMTIEVILTPPTVVTVVPVEHGTLTVSGSKNHAPDEGKNSMVIEANEKVSFDTVSDAGYRCTDVLVQFKEPKDSPWVSVLSEAGLGKVHAVAKSINCKAVFEPNSYPLIMKVNNPAWGTLSVTEKGTGTVMSIPEGVSTKQYSLLYNPTGVLEIATTAKPGYKWKSTTVSDADGTSNSSSLKLGETARMRVGGVCIMVNYEPEECYVRWNCLHGDLTVTGPDGSVGSVESYGSGGKQVKVKYGTEITVTPVPSSAEGYKYVNGSLKVNPDGGTLTDISTTKTWTVTSNATLTAEFSLEKYLITVTQSGLEGSPTDYFTASPALAADRLVEYGATLNLTAKAPTGYECKKVKLDGVEQNLSSVKLGPIKAAHTVEFIFNRIGYALAFVNETPDYGTLKVEWKEKGTTEWKLLDNSPQTVYYQDQLKITATANGGYDLEYLKLNSGAFTSGSEHTVVADVNVVAKFKAKKFKVKLQKVVVAENPDATPERGKVMVKKGTTALLTLEKAQNGPTAEIEVEYGTDLWVDAACDKGYSLVGVELTGTETKDISTTKNFKVEENVTVKVLIKQTADLYSVDWKVSKPTTSSNSSFKVQYTADDGLKQDVTKGSKLYVAGTVLNFIKTEDAGEQLLYVKDGENNPLNWEESYTLNGDVMFNVKFVRKCTIVINNPSSGTVEVRKKDGTVLKTGDMVLAGTELETRIVATSGTSGTTGCKDLKVDGVAKWTGPVSLMVAPVTTSGWITYVIPEDHTGGNVTFSGTTELYYQVRYVEPDFGHLSVTVDRVSLVSGTAYWYPARTMIKITASEIPDNGYQLNADHEVRNKGVIPEDTILLDTTSVSGTFEKSLSLDKNLDLLADFEKKVYTITVEVIHPEGSTDISLSDGMNTLLTAAGTTKVEHGSKLTLSATPATGWAVRLYFDNVDKVIGTTNQSYTYAFVKGNVTFKAEFIQKYKVVYGANIARVLHADGTEVGNGGYAYAQEKLKAVSVKPAVGQECKKLSIKENDVPGNVLGSSTTSGADGTIEYAFSMPEKDVLAEAEIGPRNYDLSYKLTGTGGTIVVKKVVGGVDQVVAEGEKVLSYGDQLKIEVTLLPANGGSDSWYKVKSVSGTMGRANILSFNTSVSGLVYTYVVTETVDGDVSFLVELERKVQPLELEIMPADQGFGVEIQIDGGTPVVYKNGYQSISVPVGAIVEARVKTPTPMPEGYEFLHFPGDGKKLVYEKKQMPINESLNWSLAYALKEIPLNIQVIPAGSGSVVAVDGSGMSYNNSVGKYVVGYGASLTQIKATPADEYYRNTGLTALMGGIDRIQGQPQPCHLDKITDSVGIEARFERLYKIVKAPSSNGVLSIVETGTTTDADGKFYPQGQSFSISVVPADKDYECKKVVVVAPGFNLSRTLVLDSQGKVTYVIPDKCVAKDLLVEAVFAKKTCQVTLKKTPANGGSAEIWIGEKDGGGTLLLDLKSTDTDTVVVKDVEYGSVLNFYADVVSSDFEIVSKKIGSTAYTGAVTLQQDTVFEVRFGRLYTLTVGSNVVVKRTDNQSEVSSGSKIPEGVSLTAQAELIGHDCIALTATKDGEAWKKWSDADTLGIIKKVFVMPGGDVDVQGSFQLKMFKVSVVHQPDTLAFQVLDIGVVLGDTTYDVDRKNGSLAGYLSELQLDQTTLQLHPWYEGPIEVKAFVKSNPAAYDLQANPMVVKEDVVIHAIAHRKKKQLNVVIDQENGSGGNQVVVKLEDGKQHIFTANSSLTVEVGAPVEIWTVDTNGYKTILLSADDGTTGPVVSAPFKLNMKNMPDADVTVTARFELKRYPVYFQANTGGRVVVNKAFGGVMEGVVQQSGDKVKHFTELTIEAEPLNESYRLKKEGLKVSMGGVAVSNLKYIASVTGEVDIKADFEKVYEVRLLQPQYGSLAVLQADTSAVGYRYPAGTGLTVNARPNEGYKVSSLTMNGQKLNQMPEEGGSIVVNIPANISNLDSVEFAVEYTLKEYQLKVIAAGEGKVTVSGLQGGDYEVKGTSRVRSASHFTQVTFVVEAGGTPYLLDKFDIHLSDGRIIPVSGQDTTIVITGNVTVDVEFKKYYWIEFNTPQYGTLQVRKDGRVVGFGDRCPGGAILNLYTVPDEGFEVDFLTANGESVINHTVVLPQNAVYDTLRIEAGYKIRTQVLTVVQPDSGYITVEKLGANGVWESLGVTAPVELDYWTQIRFMAGVYNEGGYKVSGLTMNGEPVQAGDIWTIKGDCRLEAVVEPRMYTVTYEHPMYGKFVITTGEGEEVIPGAEIAYRTELKVEVRLDDSEGYEISWIRVNGVEIENESEWTVLGDVNISALLRIKRWQVTATAQGEGELLLYNEDLGHLAIPVDTVEHYTILRVNPLPSKGWMLYSLDIDGADLQTDSTIMVTRETYIHAEYRQMEPYRFPVAFTPNGDGYNDTWVIEGLWQSRNDNTLEIYDRDQKRVYKASPYADEWNGETDNGHVLPAGNYVYKFRTATGKVYMGMVSIVRN
ncbi:gliding motility-associated C-terminal domain-containing protein [Odoribacter sp. Z80]|uniref:InlB B-repeat-containing protein n=1 Tax=Odoribacter sp. Z80 TaxID=2304575 RepID=UPI00137ABBCE|nr:gliding motility-associated C-terminal domain-containing protein [Odoribacter sp. Z80]NCE71984.1 hypothetical protein [Odoribacter sp. Z80]